MVKTIFPLVRLDYIASLESARALGAKGIVIRFQDLISHKTGEPNNRFKKIASTGGIHKFLGYNGFVILSLIMRDDLLEKLTPEKYALIIKGIMPNAYTTIDGQTYEKQESFSLKQIKKISVDTYKLLRLCPNILPIGHVKGCNEYQVVKHRDILEKMGINIFIFHVGDFSRNASSNMILRARSLSYKIKKENNILLLYGLGSPRKFLEFSFADFYISYSHIINANKGICISERGRERYGRGKPAFWSFSNLHYMFKSIFSLNKQTKLFEGGICPWVVELEVADQVYKQ
jgi:hypothetical protein